jgi:hypothetical protein
MSLVEIEFVRKNPFNGTINSRTLLVDRDNLTKWENNEMLIQNAFPHLTPGEREFIKTGLTDDEWDDACSAGGSKTDKRPYWKA